MFSISKTTGGATYTSPFVGRVDHFLAVKVDVSALTSREVDSKGYIKPGVTLNTATGLLPTAAGQKVGVVHEAARVHTDNTTLSGVTNDPLVAVGVIGITNRDIMEDNLGSAVSANEIAALDGAGSRLVLTIT